MLALHGGQRFRIEDCVVCHKFDGTDEEVRPEEELPPESIHFKWMIHKIHTGAELGEDYIIYGFRGSLHDYSHVGYPGDRRTCEGCHLEGTYGVPVPEESLPTHTSEERDYIAPMPPASAACLSCHDSVDAAAHAYTNLAPFGESCGACHGDNREFSVEQVHAH
jgi:OmcA/MtrC family decaheme c-type cytochrome